MTRPPRFLFFSPDSFGLGHLRRSLTLAGTLSGRFPEADILLVTGSPCATHFPLPPGVDLVKLPSVTKGADGQYVSRSLGVALPELIALRSHILRSVRESFQPDVVLVDHSVLGLSGELREFLRETRRAGTRTVLGLRDILDAPEAVAREWSRAGVQEALEYDYDRICVYGAPEVFDPRREYPLPPAVLPRIEFTGYVVTRGDRLPSLLLPDGPPEVLVTVGGGEDGDALVEHYTRLVEQRDLPWSSTILLGPMFAPERVVELEHRLQSRTGVEVHRFHRDVPSLLSRADVVLGMAGYNTVVETLAHRRRAVLWPRRHPRREQELRALRMSELGLCDVLGDLSPDALERTVSAALARPTDWDRCPPLGGAERLCDVVEDLVPSRLPRAAVGGGRA